ncbi:MAG: TonB-dependent receptor [Candidatus Eremiobacteraeota bacterium]|nr:TonB-dependent receptor [Candidatus Eremiobacteraeota bacterium]
MLHSLGRSFLFFALVFAAGSLCARAGTTGTITGVVVSTTQAPVAGARVVATSPSQTSIVTTDASGRFALLSLAPDTYTISASKAGFDTAALTGVSVFADQVQTIRVSLAPSLRTIARVTARSTMDLVKPGTTSDVYSVNSTVTQAAAGLGGGGNLNNAYSAIASVPGAFVPPNQQGWDQVVYIRGGAPDQIGYEFDGVPVNRSFDNYPGGTAATLGQQELQVYTGGGTAGESATGLAGFINQVIKTGTYPGYATASGGIGTPTYYHNLQVEVGGATPDRLFSYYVGIGGYNQGYRYLDQFNGASLGDVWGYPNIAYNTTNLLFGGVYPTCGYTPRSNSGFYSGPNSSPVYDPFTLRPGQPGYLPLPVGVANDPGCYQTISPAYDSYSDIADRENVLNMHVGIPHRHDAGRDDIQMLYNVTSIHSAFYSSANDIGPNLVQQLNALNVYRSCRFPNSSACAAHVADAPPEIWGDFVTWPSGTQFGENAADVSAVPYFAPSSPGNRCANVNPTVLAGPAVIPGACPGGVFADVPADARDAFWNNASIVKLQYQHNIGSNAYFRLYGYTFYSDWLQTSPLSEASGLYGFGVTSYDYELESHTRGLAFTYANQLNSQHLLTFDANYTTASTNRYNNTNYNNTLGTDATNLTNGTQCFAYTSGSFEHESYQAGQPAPCNSPLTSGTFQYPIPPGSVSVPGATWQVTNTGNSGFLNNVEPNFTSVALEDLWDPTDKLNVDLGLREELYEYNLANTSSNGQNFWFLAGQREFCYNPITLAPYFIPVPPASGKPAQPFIGFNCPIDNSIPAHPVQTVHPDGLDGHLLLSNNYPSTVSDYAFTPRLGLTYTLNPDTVLRFSAGRYAQEPETYQVQYNAKDSNLAYDLFQAFWQYGYTTPLHNPLVQYSDNYDASFERRFKGTDMSIKITPYYRYATNQVYSISLPFGLSGGLNSGVERVDGFETEFTKGDFNKNGLSFLLSYTYTNAAERWANFPGTTINPIDPYNQDIANFNGLTRAGDGSRCYESSHQGVVYPDPSCKQLKPQYNPPILNPYYTMSPQPLLDRNGWFPVGLDFAYLSPSVLSAIVNYKHNRFTITPALTFNQGQPYGNPADVIGLDPRTCSGNSEHIPTAKSPLQADYTTCGLAATQSGTFPGVLYIPNPQTGVFDNFGAFHQPNQLNLTMQIGYQLTPRVKVNLLLANLMNACFGGSSEPWTKQYPPNSYTCGYVSGGPFGSSYYVSNFYNGSSPNDRAANGVPLNPAFAQSYTPAYADTNSLVLPNPFNAYLQFNITL